MPPVNLQRKKSIKLFFCLILSIFFFGSDETLLHSQICRYPGLAFRLYKFRTSINNKKKKQIEIEN